MKVNPIITTERLIESKDFYTRSLGFQVVFESDWYVHLRADREEGQEIAFMLPNHHTQPPIFQTPFQGKGLILLLEVDDVITEYATVKSKGVNIELELVDEPWGERHFALLDPNGIALNISQMIAPDDSYAAGYVEV